MFYYQTMGISIRSHIELPELLNVLDLHCYDLDITIGVVPESVHDALLFDEEFQISNKEFLFYEKGIAKYYVTDGSKIIIQSESDINGKKVRSRLIGTMFSIVLFQRETLLFHGSTVTDGNRALIIAGFSGAGKSTLCAGLCKSGFMYTADDMSAVDARYPSRVLVHPSHPKQRVTQASMMLLGLQEEEKELAYQDDDKWVLCSQNFYLNKTLPLKAIISMTTYDENTVQFHEIQGIEKIRVLAECLYNYYLYKQIGFNESTVRLLEIIANQVRVISIFRPRELDTLDVLKSFATNIFEVV